MLEADGLLIFFSSVFPFRSHIRTTLIDYTGAEREIHACYEM